jgi:hypothetical protein
MRYCIAMLCCFVFFNSHAQQFGATPSSIKWRQINTDTARIIFPEGLEKQAIRAATVLHAMQAKHASTIGDSLKKISIVFNPFTTYSNGYVGLSPWRSEFYLTAPQDAFGLGAQNWVDNLTIHEYRHVQQYNNFNKGLSKIASIILGQDGRAVANAAAIPDWFFEGDAVFNETKLSEQGRGKLPLFLSGYKSLFNNGKQYSFMKLRNGSFKDFVPNHYPLGYMLVAYGYEKYGNDFWKKVTDDAARFKPLVYPFQGAVKKQANISYNQFVKDAINFYQTKWEEGLSETVDMMVKRQAANHVDYKKIIPMKWLTKAEKNNVVDYKYPIKTEDGSLIVLKESYKTIPAFYRIGDGVETKIAVRDIAYDGYFSYNNGKIVYAAYQPDARWDYREYSNIKLLDLATKEVKNITTKRRYFSPDISHDGQKIIAVGVGPDQGSAIHILNMEGAIIDDVRDENTIYSYPKFSTDGNTFYFVARKNSGEMAIYRKGIQSRVTDTLIPFSNRVINYLQVQHDTLLFNASYKGQDGQFAYVLSSKTIYQLATYSTGIYQSALQNDGSLVASVFTADGYRLASIKPSWDKVDFSQGALADLYIAPAFNPADHHFLSTLQPRTFQTKKYRKASGLINFHSWRPYYDDPEFSFTIYGQNVLNTFQSELAYTYNQNEGSSKVGYTGIYGATYLQPFFSVNQTWDRNALYNPTTRVFWNEFNANAGLQLPLNLSGGKQYRYLTLSSSYNSSQVRWIGIAKGALEDYNINYLNTRLSYSSQVQKAVQHIYPRWAQTFSMQYKNVLNKYTANQLLLNAALYLPGIGKNHSLVLNASYQSRDTANQYYFSNSFPFSKGYRAVDFPRMYKVSGNYHFPLAYPDWGFGQIVYFLRVRANAFYDYTQTKSLRTGNTFNFSTAGGEIYFDTKWWNQHPVTFGIRYSRLLDNEYAGTTQPNQWEFILPVNLFNR